MPFLSPAKLLVILVVALVVLGPDKLPKVAKQIGGLWSDFAKFRQKLESDVRGSFPDLPSTATITRAVRSPMTLLDTLAKTDHTADVTPPETRPPEAVATDASDDGMVRTQASVAAARVAPTDAGRAIHQLRVPDGHEPNDPGMN